MASSPRSSESPSASGTDRFLEVSELLLMQVSKISSQTSTWGWETRRAPEADPDAHKQGSTAGGTSKPTPNAVKPTLYSGEAARGPSPDGRAFCGARAQVTARAPGPLPTQPPAGAQPEPLCQHRGDPSGHCQRGPAAAGRVSLVTVAR